MYSSIGRRGSKRASVHGIVRGVRALLPRADRTAGEYGNGVSGRSRRRGACPFSAKVPIE